MLTTTTAPAALDRLLLTWTKRLFAFGLLGYLVFDRAFAWLHVPGLPLFYGEIMFAVGIVAILSSTGPLHQAWAQSAPLRVLAAFMIWGAILFPTGFLTWGTDAIRDSALWYYGLAAFLAAYLIARDNSTLDAAIRGYGRIAPWLILWLPFSILGNALLDDHVPVVPDSSVSILAHRPGNVAIHAAMIVIALFSFLDTRREDHAFRAQRAWMTALAVLTIMFAGVQNRGALLAGLLGLGVFALTLQRRRRAELVLTSLGLLIAIGSTALVFDLRLSVFANDREVSVEGIVENFTSVLSPSDASTQRGNTANWRLDLWRRVIDDVASESPATGFGFGENIRDRFGEQDEDPPARGPHNSHVNVFARMGGVGVALWTLLWVAWYATVFRTRRRFLARDDERLAGVALWLMISCGMILINAVVDPTLEGPQVATWAWTLFGVGSALPLLLRRTAVAHP